MGRFDCNIIRGSGWRSRPTPPQIVQIRDDISYEGIANSLLIITTQAELRLSGAGAAIAAVAAVAAVAAGSKLLQN